MTAINVTIAVLIILTILACGAAITIFLMNTLVPEKIGEDVGSLEIEDNKIG